MCTYMLVCADVCTYVDVDIRIRMYMYRSHTWVIIGSPGGPPGGWLIDGDSIWLRRAPRLSVAWPPELGHFFGAQQACKAMRGHTKESTRRHWSMHYLKTPGDFEHIAFPMACPGDSPVLNMWFSAMETTIYGRMPRGGVPQQAYNSFMEKLQSAVCENGMEGAITSTTATSLVPRLSSKHAIVAAKRHLFDLSGVDQAICVNNCWQSSIECGGGPEAHKLGDQVVEEGSAWYEIVAKAKATAACPTKRLRGKHLWQAPAATPLRRRHQLALVASPGAVDDCPLQQVACPQQQVLAPATVGAPHPQQPSRDAATEMSPPRQHSSDASTQTVSKAAKCKDACVGHRKHE